MARVLLSCDLVYPPSGARTGRGRKGDEPAVILLLVKAPLAAEVTATNEEEPAHGQCDKRDKQFVVRPTGGDRRRTIFCNQGFCVQGRDYKSNRNPREPNLVSD
jgi:hypothetical protein